MYHMVHSGMTTSQARDRLLAAAVAQAMRGGIADMSLRELAAAIGTSHRMLLYHFGSREGLLTAVARAVEEGQRAVVSEWGITRANARRLWQHFSDPQLWPAERLFFELYAHALLARPGTEGFLDHAIEPWVTALTPAIAKEAGLDDQTARAEARLAVAVTRGLLLDLLATGDRDGVTEAFERYLLHTEAVFPQATFPPAGPARDQPAVLASPMWDTALTRSPRGAPRTWRTSPAVTASSATARACAGGCPRPSSARLTEKGEKPPSTSWRARGGR